jgi:hypothetical protein
MNEEDYPSLLSSSVEESPPSIDLASSDEDYEEDKSFEFTERLTQYGWSHIYKTTELCQCKLFMSVGLRHDYGYHYETAQRIAEYYNSVFRGAIANIDSIIARKRWLGYDKCDIEAAYETMCAIHRRSVYKTSREPRFVLPFTHNAEPESNTHCLAPEYAKAYLIKYVFNRTHKIRGDLYGVFSEVYSTLMNVKPEHNLFPVFASTLLRNAYDVKAMADDLFAFPGPHSGYPKETVQPIRCYDSIYLWNPSHFTEAEKKVKRAHAYSVIVARYRVVPRSDDHPEVLAEALHVMRVIRPLHYSSQVIGTLAEDFMYRGVISDTVFAALTKQDVQMMCDYVSRRDYIESIERQYSQYLDRINDRGLE